MGARAAGASGRALSCVATSSKARELSLPKSFPVFPCRKRSQPPESVSTRPVRPTTGSRFGALPVGSTSWVAYRVGRNQRDRNGGGDDPTPRARWLGRRSAFPSTLRIIPNCGCRRRMAKCPIATLSSGRSLALGPTRPPGLRRGFSAVSHPSKPRLWERVVGLKVADATHERGCIPGSRRRAGEPDQRHRPRTSGRIGRHGHSPRAIVRRRSAVLDEPAGGSRPCVAGLENLKSDKLLGPDKGARSASASPIETLDRP